MALWRHGKLTGLLAAGAVAAGVNVNAQQAEPGQDAEPAAPSVRRAPQPEELEGLVRDLGAPAVQTRIDASARVFEGPFTLKDIEGQLRRSDLSAEQRGRLLRIAHRRFESEPRGAMGIEFNMEAPDIRGALIRHAKREFHSGEVLRPHDRIIEADGVPIERRDALRRIIVSHDPGDEVPLIVEREGATIRVTVRLGEFRLLNQPKDRVVQDQAWALRSSAYARHGAGPDVPVECGLQPTAWTPGLELDDDAELMGVLPSQRARFLPGDERTGATAGGESRLGLASVRPGVDQVLRGPQAGMTRALAQAYAMRNTLHEQLSMISRRLADPQTPEADKQLLRARVEQIAENVRRVEEDIRRHSAQPPRR